MKSNKQISLKPNNYTSEKIKSLQSFLNEVGKDPEL